MKWLKNFERLQELQQQIIWRPITELEPRSFIPEVRTVSIIDVKNVQIRIKNVKNVRKRDKNKKTFVNVE